MSQSFNKKLKLDWISFIAFIWLAAFSQTITIACVMWVVFAALRLLAPRLICIANEWFIERYRRRFAGSEIIVDSLEEATIKPDGEAGRKASENFTESVQAKIKARDRMICQYCFIKTIERDSGIGARTLTAWLPKRKKRYVEIDHLLPTSKCGKPTIENGVTSCRECNRAKSDKLKDPFLDRVIELVIERQPSERIWSGCIG